MKPQPIKKLTPRNLIQEANGIKQQEPQERKQFETVKGRRRTAWKVGIYGEPGVGKSTLASLCHGAVFADIEESMLDLDVDTVAGITCWEDLRAWVKQQEGDCIRGIDSMSKAEDWCAEYVIKTKTKDGEHAVTSIEDFKYGAGAKFVADEFRMFLSDIERSFKSGTSWIMIAHDKIEWFKNPDDKDFMFHNPDLLDSRRGSCRSDWIRFCDHIAFIAKDVAVIKGKATGGDTRTIYLDGSANRVSKQRGLEVDVISWDETDTIFWDTLKVLRPQPEKTPQPITSYKGEAK